MTGVRHSARTRGLTFITAPWVNGRRQARLRNTQRLREGGAGRAGRPRAWNTLHFSRLRLKGSPTALAAGISSGADVARRRAFATSASTMSERNDTTTDASIYQERLEQISQRLQDCSEVQNIRQWRGRLIFEYDGEGYQITGKNLCIVGSLGHRDVLGRMVKEALTPDINVGPQDRGRDGFPSIPAQQLEGGDSR